jgi:hypothetical protein
MSSEHKNLDPLPIFMGEGITNEPDEVINIGFIIRRDFKYQIKMYAKNSSMEYNLSPEV